MIGCESTGEGRVRMGVGMRASLMTRAPNLKRLMRFTSP